MTRFEAPLLLALPESEAIARDIAEVSAIEPALLEDRRFEGGEFKLRPLASVRDRQVFVVQSLAGSPDATATDRLIRLLFALFTLRDGGASHITALIPYLSFARKDRRTQPRDPVNTRYVAQLLEATGVDRVVALDVHNPTALDNGFRIPVDHLSAIPMFVDHFARNCSEAQLAVASPDVGGVKRAQLFRELLERRLARSVELVFVEKRRAAGVLSSGRAVGDVEGCEVIVLDDLCASGGTLLRAAGTLRSTGASAVHAAFTHAPQAEGLAAILSSDSFEQIVLTDSVGSQANAKLLSGDPRVTLLSAGRLFGEAVRRMLTGEHLAPLLDGWPPEQA